MNRAVEAAIAERQGDEKVAAAREAAKEAAARAATFKKQSSTKKVTMPKLDETSPQAAKVAQAYRQVRY